jgi:hypothetical protein
VQSRDKQKYPILYYRGTKVTDKGIKALKAAMSKVEIEP